ncbi:unnamed protein product [Periconia digitata]|uniref:Uncharacterized protein n=1 Tax=Periconia digitata TaxID=1303443 RepID=A0A9W4UEJ2_9PLEO|nr:unnamed protein product [Periconia digitata]
MHRLWAAQRRVSPPDGLAVAFCLGSKRSLLDNRGEPPHPAARAPPSHQPARANCPSKLCPAPMAAQASTSWTPCPSSPPMPPPIAKLLSENVPRLPGPCIHSPIQSSHPFPIFFASQGNPLQLPLLCSFLIANSDLWRLLLPLNRYRINNMPADSHIRCITALLPH